MNRSGPTLPPDQLITRVADPQVGRRRGFPAGWLDRAARHLVLRRLAGLDQGRLSIQEGRNVLNLGAGGGLRAGLTLHHPAFWRHTAAGGTLGAAEAYLRGYWDSDDLTELVRLLVRNRQHLDAMESGIARFAGAAQNLWHRTRANTRRGARRNIAEHYDLSNEFFALWLDEQMMYSSATFTRAGMSLAQASTAKLERICRKLELGADDHLLEIGTGWGGLAIHAARHHGCRVTTTTISSAQAREARTRIAAAGLTGRITLLEQDYRDLTGQYDKLVSIEMVEAVGDKFLNGFFRQCRDLLKPGGRMLLQAITIEDQRFHQALRSVDFIKKYIFPGSFIPSVSRLTAAAGESAGLRLTHLEDLGSDYALTLRDWRQRFEAAREALPALGFDERFTRLWRFYLAYCEGGFLEQSISDVQMLFSRGPHPGRSPWRGCSDRPDNVCLEYLEETTP